ncbi:class I tRNA ligase family protein [Ktedonobacter robiniae]|uniref:valine--tRNA ligase n=1 Tax=Ktedonobacter robiniae TaxID=2778365 RepID=A0ABQ3URJ1_9CHLR|nr:class I tRNA ligase family protein [Ktedonobacter robiniae]GHO55346.1 hypothetical protein KSB_38210 [Ktedonobacter robiniae]
MGKGLYLTGEIPWREVLVSGHALSAERSKISKSKGNSHAGGPLELVERESADALRYWATSIKPGLDTPFHPELIANGRRLVTKLWNAARFAARHLQELSPEEMTSTQELAGLLPTDRWLLARLAHTIEHATLELRENDYAAARAEVERFFWSDLCDNYLELVKARLYNGMGEHTQAARWTLYQALLAVIKLLAPYMPFITEEIYQGLFQEREGVTSLHLASWPQAPAWWQSARAEADGQALLDLLKQVRRYKAEQGLSVGAELERLELSVRSDLKDMLEAALVDLKSATRARELIFTW